MSKIDIRKYLYFVFSVFSALLILLFVQGSEHQLRVVADDYFYYYRVAANFVQGKGLTYSDHILTNGFQPIWQAVVVALVYLNKYIVLDNAFFAVLINFFCFCWGMLYLQKRFLLQANAFNISLLFSLSIGAIYFSLNGMEVGLLFIASCYLLACYKRTSVSPYYFILLLFTACLARLDAIVYFFPFASYFILRSKTKILPISFAALLGLSYLALNQFYFGSALPISGLAKSVTRLQGFNYSAFVTMFDSINMRLYLALIILQTAIALYYSPKQNYSYILLSSVGVVLYFLVNFLRSDWSIFTWYYFPYLLQSVALVVVAPDYVVPSKNRFAWLVCAFAFMLFCSNVIKASKTILHPENDIYDHAVILQALFKDKPNAVLAMGDQAGALGRLVPNNIIQLEGLVMDQRFLDHLSSDKSLSQLLEFYDVDYYIAAYPRDLGNGCYVVSEPRMSREKSRKLQSTICYEVVKKIQTPGVSIMVFKVK